jgi:hypothetical protein
MKRSYGVVHGVAKCEDCDWKTESYRTLKPLRQDTLGSTGIRFKGI